MIEKNDPYRIAQRDQADAGISDIGRTCGVFYQAFINNGVPAALAKDLVRQWFYLQSCKALWPDMPPPSRIEDDL